LDYDKKEIKLYVASRKFNFKLSSALASINGEEHPAHILNSFCFVNLAQILITIPFHNAFIDLFGSEDRTVVVKCSVEVQNKKTISIDIRLKLPFVMQSKISMEKYEPVNFDKVVHDMYRHEFDVSKMEAEEKELHAKLEDFKKMEIEERYRKHGYGKMLKTFLDIEDCEEVTALQKFSINNVKLLPIDELKPKEYRYKIQTKEEIPESSNYANLIPMTRYRPGMANSEQGVIQVSIEEFNKKHIVIEIDADHRQQFEFGKNYRFELIPNFYVSTMSKLAIDRIETAGFENFLLRFTKDSCSLNLKSSPEFKKFSDDYFEWMNPNISTNEAQVKAITNIVNRTSYPSPFVVFGGPGCGKTSMAVETVSFIFYYQASLTSFFTQYRLHKS
jgi:hypothetical protein